MKNLIKTLTIINLFTFTTEREYLYNICASNKFGTVVIIEEGLSNQDALNSINEIQKSYCFNNQYPTRFVTRAF
jgi:hypothetical protein